MSGRMQPWGARIPFPDPAVGLRWSARRTLAFVVLSSVTLWIAILAAGQFLTAI